MMYANAENKRAREGNWNVFSPWHEKTGKFGDCAIPKDSSGCSKLRLRVKEWQSVYTRIFGDRGISMLEPH